MKRLLNYLPFHFLTGLVAGIWIQDVWSIWSAIYLELCFSFFIFCCVVFFLKKKMFLFPVVWYFFLLLGMFVTHQSDTRNHQAYFEHFLSEESYCILQVTEVLKPNAFSFRYAATVIQVDSLRTKGNVLMSIRKDSLFSGLQVEDRIWIRADFQEIKPPLNPHQFDYKSYLERQGIYHQLYLNKDEFFPLESSSSFLGWISIWRSKLQSSLQSEGFSSEEFGVINALLLGQRQEVSKELLNDYSKAGAIHILAISGLHVGIILLILSWLFKPLEVFKKGKYVKLIFMVLLLWFFALLAGMSASVIRAVTMFTAVALGQSLQRRNSVVYSLVFSMFVLLVFKPMFLFDVGFQLSYLAVYGIVTMQPKLSELWKPKWKLMDKIWQLTTVSLSAQLAVLPLSLYYFHQFPGLFLLSNLVIVPFLGIILIGGILVLTLSVLSWLPEILVKVYGAIISWMNEFVRLVSAQEAFLFSGISFSGWMLFTSYLVVVFGYRFFEERRPQKLLYFLLSILFFQSVLWLEKYESQTQNAFLVFHQNRKSIYGIRTGNQVQLLDSFAQNTTIASYAVGENVELVLSKRKINYLHYQNQDILFVDSLGVYKVDGMKSPIVLLQHSPKINLERMIHLLRPKQIVADGSNYKSLISLWQQTCEEMKIPFWNTGEKGTFVLNEKRLKK